MYWKYLNMFWTNGNCCRLTEGTILSRNTEDSYWHFISKRSFRYGHNNARPHYRWVTNVRELSFALLRQLKYMHPFPFLHLYWLIGRADVPRSHPHGTLTPSCHSNDNSFIYRHRSCCKPDRLAGPGQLHHSLAQPPIHLYLHCQFPKFHLPIICTFSPSITIPASTSLSLICFSYSLSDLSLPFQRNLLFTASTSPSASCQPQHFFLTWVKPRTVCPIQMGPTSQDFVMDWLISPCLLHLFTVWVECCFYTTVAADFPESSVGLESL